MPAFALNGNLVYFAAYKKHIGFYPTSSGIKKFQTELTKYKTTKGAIQFPMDQPLPLKLITKIVKYRIKENAQTKKVNLEFVINWLRTPKIVKMIYNLCGSDRPKKFRNYFFIHIQTGYIKEL
ncbi:PF08818 domain protein [Leptospira interrogans serovar Bataviae str. HAI135]|nr:PF08818 domain protein [Leptospira interrogans serovar Bataviae str. HAI135]